jgi:hypothetical protein
VCYQSIESTCLKLMYSYPNAVNIFIILRVKSIKRNTTIPDRFSSTCFCGQFAFPLNKSALKNPLQKSQLTRHN